MEAGGVQGVTAVLQVSEVLPRMRLLSAGMGRREDVGALLSGRRNPGDTIINWRQNPKGCSVQWFGGCGAEAEIRRRQGSLPGFQLE